jgi:hypothetical protein
MAKASANSSTYTIQRLEADAFDVRLHHRHIADGRITREQLAQTLAALPDVAREGMDVQAVLVENRGRGPARTAESSDD